MGCNSHFSDIDSHVWRGMFFNLSWGFYCVHFSCLRKLEYSNGQVTCKLLNHCFVEVLLVKLLENSKKLVE
jgi:hypothetical protein